MTKNLTRRIFLRGLGGAVVAAPFLGSVAERTAKAQSGGAEGPKRLIVFFTHNGCITNRWFPKKAHGTLTGADYEATTLKHLAPFAPKLLVPRGIRAMNEWSLERTYGQNNDPHTQVIGSYFTCHPVTPESDKLNAKPTGRSLDHFCAEQVNPNGAPPLVMSMGQKRQDTRSNISYSAPGEIFGGVRSPIEVFNDLTNLFGQGPVSPDSYKVARGKSIVDIVRDDLARLQRVDMSQSDKRKLSDWVDLLHQTSGTVRAECSAGIAAALGLTPESVQAAEGDGSSFDVPKRTKVILDLAVLSAICDQNRVIFMKFPPAVVFKWDGIVHGRDSDGLSHRTGTQSIEGDCALGVLEMLREIDDWYAKKFAYLVGRLDSIEEGDVKLLDNTATVWFQECSDGAARNLNNLPILQAGSCGGYFKVGQAVNVDGGSADLTRGNSEGACKWLDGPSVLRYNELHNLGTPPTVASQPINKYFCNLMNAIGVKAGPDGFPAIGGTREVTRFGKHDDTKLFADVNNPPDIKDPGEFTALRASS
ncbi:MULTISPECIES: DUF1552 domain-containing protein [Sorangium]|uniref:Tat pathway signal sequence n=1 Tax=Sorangium cellulosum TaxID=56 RepID=A0A4P2QFU5_SORCE|nr:MULTISPECIES: DUF1552 domain-containing protein [Sorangium]AUX28727.1 hypothetical protein SOCE836_008080 [Sorangium cellulosum]WCQ88124.1 hypothetical protein NQZ70_00796 [Sorangium sp. Soce836]